MSDAPSSGGSQLRIVVADDDPFTVSLVCDALRAQGFAAHGAATPEQAEGLVAEIDAHALISDLNFGTETSGADLLHRVHESSPWVALVVLTAHQSPELAVKNVADLPRDAVYLVKSQLTHAEQLATAITRAISGQGREKATAAPAILITSSQADVMRRLAAGESTKTIADSRGTTTRAAEAMLNRLYDSLGVSADSGSSSRVAAVQLWHQGRIRVK